VDLLGLAAADLSEITTMIVARVEVVLEIATATEVNHLNCFNVLILINLNKEAEAAADNKKEEVIAKAIGFAQIVKTKTLHGVTNAIDAKHQKLTMELVDRVRADRVDHLEIMEIVILVIVMEAREISVAEECVEAIGEIDNNREAAEEDLIAKDRIRGWQFLPTTN
jgi:hypothetical protein